MLQIFHSPILLMSTYKESVEGPDEVVMPECVMEVVEMWTQIYHVGTIIVFFTIPFLILTALYTTITRHLIANPIISRDPESNLVKYRRQVVLMLGTVVVSFFCCLLPFRVFEIWFIFFLTEDSFNNFGVINYYLVLYVCRFLVYLNSAVNPILYNIMSTKFRDGFQKLCCRRNVDHSSGNTPIRNSRMTSSTPTQITLKSNSAKSGDDFEFCRIIFFYGFVMLFLWTNVLAGSSTSCTFATTSSIKYNTNIYNDLSINCENNVNIFLTEQNPVVKTDKQSKFPFLIHEKNTITILGKSTETYV